MAKRQLQKTPRPSIRPRMQPQVTPKCALNRNVNLDPTDSLNPIAETPDVTAKAHENMSPKSLRASDFPLGFGLAFQPLGSTSKIIEVSGSQPGTCVMERSCKSMATAENPSLESKYMPMPTCVILNPKVFCVAAFQHPAAFTGAVIITAILE